LGCSLYAQRGIGVLAGDLQRLLARQGKHGNQDEQQGAHDAALRAEMRRAESLHKASEDGGGMSAHTEGIDRMCFS
jgi:hypothetical protein